MARAGWRRCTSRRTSGTTGGFLPLPDSGGRDSLIAVPVAGRGATLEPGRGRALFGNRFASLNYHAPYDVSPGGTWFAFVGVTGSQVSTSFRITINWFDQPWKP